jgi:hypothetical protein
VNSLSILIAATCSNGLLTSVLLSYDPNKSRRAILAAPATNVETPRKEHVMNGVVVPKHEHLVGIRDCGMQNGNLETRESI